MHLSLIKRKILNFSLVIPVLYLASQAHRRRFLLSGVLKVKVIFRYLLVLRSLRLAGRTLLTGDRHVFTNCHRKHSLDSRNFFIVSLLLVIALHLRFSLGNRSFFNMFRLLVTVDRPGPSLTNRSALILDRFLGTICTFGRLFGALLRLNCCVYLFLRSIRRYFWRCGVGIVRNLLLLGSLSLANRSILIVDLPVVIIRNFRCLFENRLRFTCCVFFFLRNDRRCFCNSRVGMVIDRNLLLLGSFTLSRANRNVLVMRLLLVPTEVFFLLDCFIENLGINGCVAFFLRDNHRCFQVLLFSNLLLGRWLRFTYRSVLIVNLLIVSTRLRHTGGFLETLRLNCSVSFFRNNWRCFFGV